jgi:hypothetical protein
MLLLSPLAWTNYFVLLLLPIGLVLTRSTSQTGRILLAVILAILSLPENFFLVLAIGRQETEALVYLRHAPLGPEITLTVIPLFTYALVGLFLLILLDTGRPGRTSPADDR